MVLRENNSQIFNTITSIDFGSVAPSSAFDAESKMLFKFRSEQVPDQRQLLPRAGMADGVGDPGVADAVDGDARDVAARASRTIHPTPISEGAILSGWIGSRSAALIRRG
jgi:hypothetical protein